jgi:hypothetical protein
MKQFYFLIILIGFILEGCSDEETQFNNRIQLYLNDELAEEYIYTEDSLLLVETSYYQPFHVSLGGIGGVDKPTGIVYRYEYNEQRSVDQVEISDLAGNYLRKEVHLYTDGTLDVIRIFFPHVKPLSSFELLDYIYWGGSTNSYLDSSDYKVGYLNGVPYRYREQTYTTDEENNIKRFQVGVFPVVIKYDVNKNPFRKMRFSRISPLRLSINNPVNIITGCTAGCGTGEYDLQYEYNDEGFPENVKMIDKYSSEVRNLRYVYDKVPK